MSTGYKHSGSECFDNQFKAIGGSSPRSATGIKVGGTDIANLFYASTGGDTSGNSSTGFAVGGTDVASLFRNISFIAYAATLSNSAAIMPIGETAGSSGTVITKFKLTNTGQAQYFETTGAGSYQTISGDWLLAGVASDYSVRWNHNSSYSMPTGYPGAENTWVDFSVDREWVILTGTIHTNVETRITIDIAATSDTSTVLASATIIMHAIRA